MLNLRDIQNIPFFQKKLFQKGDIIFDEGVVDGYIYIVLSGQLSVEKYVSQWVKEVKKLAILNTWDIFWEGALSDSLPKQVRVQALSQGELVFIDVQKDMEKCIQQFPVVSFSLLKEIISLTNKRLLISNREVTVNFEITKYINNMESLDIKSFALLFDNISRVFWSDYLLYLEKKEFIEHTLVIRYDTREPGKFQNKVITFPDDFKRDVLEEYGINLWNNTLIQKITIGWTLLWYIVFGNKEAEFTDSDKRNSQLVASSLVWILRQKKLLDEERDKNYLKNSF